MKNNSLSILITGDLVITQPYKAEIDQNIIDLFKKSDLNMVNLEAPVTNCKNKIIKTGQHLQAEISSTLNVLKALDINVVTLANNHIRDYGEVGVRDTLAFCKKNAIGTIGAGVNLKEAQQTIRKVIGNHKITIINFAENEWASASDHFAGANPMDIVDNIKQIQAEKKYADKVIVIVHGGHEYYNLPSPRMVKQYRFYADNGADLIVGHHTHCINGNEVYNGVPIYYSLGNFLFTKRSRYEDWYTGLILEVTISETGDLFTDIHPVRQEKEVYQLKLLQGREKDLIVERIVTYNEIIKDEERLRQHWEEFINRRYNSYLNYWSLSSYISNRYLKHLFNKLKLSAVLITKNSIALKLNLMRCEAHADLSKAVLGKYLNKKRS